MRTATWQCLQTVSKLIAGLRRSRDRVAKPPEELLVLAAQWLREPVAEAIEKLAVALGLTLPCRWVHGDQLLESFAPDVEAAQIHRIRGWHVANGGHPSPARSGHAFENPFEHANVLAEAGPEKFVL